MQQADFVSIPRGSTALPEYAAFNRPYCGCHRPAVVADCLRSFTLAPATLDGGLRTVRGVRQGSHGSCRQATALPGSRFHRALLQSNGGLSRCGRERIQGRLWTRRRRVGRLACGPWRDQMRGRRDQRRSDRQLLRTLSGIPRCLAELINLLKGQPMGVENRKPQASVREQPGLSSRVNTPRVCCGYEAHPARDFSA